MRDFCPLFKCHPSAKKLKNSLITFFFKISKPLKYTKKNSIEEFFFRKFVFFVGFC